MIKIYALADPRTSRIRYVGATGSALLARLLGHLRRPSNGKMRRWLAELAALGLRPAIGELPREFADWQDDERGWIAHFRLQGCLLNVDPGGICRRGGKLIGRAKNHRRRKPARAPDPCGAYLARNTRSEASIHPSIRRRENKS